MWLSGRTWLKIYSSMASYRLQRMKEAPTFSVSVHTGPGILGERGISFYQTRRSVHKIPSLSSGISRFTYWRFKQRGSGAIFWLLSPFLPFPPVSFHLILSEVLLYSVWSRDVFLINAKDTVTTLKREVNRQQVVCPKGLNNIYLP